MILQLFKGCYPYFSLIAVAVMVWRIKNKCWTAAETTVACALFLHILLEYVQLFAGDGKLDMPRRYLLPVAPLFFIWAAHGIAGIYRACPLPEHIKRAVIVVIGIFLLYDGMKPSLQYYFSAKKQTETQINMIAGDWIKQDYRGPAHTAARRHPEMYHSPYLPTVYCRYSNLAYRCGGRIEPSPFGDLPDYWVVPENTAAPADGVKQYAFRAGKEKFLIYKRVAK